MDIRAYMLSCPEREQVRESTLASLAGTDWGEAPVIELDRSEFARPEERQTQTALRLLERAVMDTAELFLFLEDDLQFNVHLRHNLTHWYPLESLNSSPLFFGSLYNPNIWELERVSSLNFFVAHPDFVYGSQAFVLSREMARYIIEHWSEVIGMQDIKMSRLAARLARIHYHSPSLVQHVGKLSMWGGPYHWTPDFHPTWRATRDSRSDQDQQRA
ncbi:MAG: hypothetical protein JOY61_26625 [Chloroflexi bacterium]|nr:hypothetical protein [Chloroflexota bacterium]